MSKRLAWILALSLVGCGESMDRGADQRPGSTDDGGIGFADGRTGRDTRADPGLADAGPGADARGNPVFADAGPGADATGPIGDAATPPHDATTPTPDATTPTPDAAPPADSGPPIIGLPYPTRSGYRIKGIQPDFWQPRAEISGNGVGGVAMNLVWASWEPSRRTPPCGGGQQQYGGRCFDVNAAVDAAIRDYTADGVVVTAVVYGVPAWARTGNTNCSPLNSSFEIFCAADNPADYGRFAGMLARRYDGTRGHGRIADFVIHNEVNSNVWYDIGCGHGTACNTAAWIQSYSDNYNAAYDAIKLHQSEARVLISLEHEYGKTFDLPANNPFPILSAQTMIEGVAARAGDRAWAVAFHPYPPNLLKPEFSVDDLPKVTYGNIGVLVGWLRKRFADTPSAWTIQLTESGVNSVAPNSSEAAQATGVCNSFRNVLGTPGIENYIYHRMKDHPVEVADGLGVGLRRADNSAKPAWAVWALANRHDLQPPKLDCGFEHLPYTHLSRHYRGGSGHWTSTRLPPAGFASDAAAWYLLRDPAPGTTLLYECKVGAHNMLTKDVGCEGQQEMGPVGYVHDSPGGQRVALYRCRIDSPLDHFVSSEADCEGFVNEQLLGYVLPAP